MLVYEQEGSIEADPKSIKQLCRSTATVNLDNGGRDAFEVLCSLCDFIDHSEPCCRVAFYARNLKRALVFTVNVADRESSWNHGREVLSRLGFKLEDVNLKLSPVLLEVVLRDVPGFATPAEARKLNEEKERTLAEHQKVYDNAPESAEGKKAALKLNAEKRNQERLLELRKVLEGLLQPVVSAAVDIEALSAQLKAVETRLATAETRAETERRKREMSESITAAAEKRIQELEKILVDVETSSAEVLKQKRKMVKLQGQIKDLSNALDSAEQTVTQGQEKQQQLAEEVKAAQDRILLLEGDLEDAGRLLASEKTLLVDEQSKKARLEECLKEAERQIKSLDRNIEKLQVKATDFDESVKRAEVVQAQLAETQQTLLETTNHNEQLQQDLKTALAQCAALTRDLREAETSAREEMQEAKQLKALKEQNEQLSRDLRDLRADYDGECRFRQDLVDRAAQDVERINELQEALVKLTKEVQTPASMENELEETTPEVETLRDALCQLRGRLDHEANLREELETELHQAYELINKLEKMVRQTSRTGETPADVDSPKSASPVSQEITEKLKSLEDQLDAERTAKKKVSTALAAAEKQLAEQQVLLSQVQPGEKAKHGARLAADEAVDSPRSKSAKPLPHELRPAPRKGALFCPDWDLQGLPCRSSGQVSKAWEAAFNVKISLEGYPSQYCMAFLVVLSLKKQERLFMLFRLRQNKHTLVCVPVKAPEDEAALQKTIAEGLNFLKLSGFEMAEMAVENVDSTLGSYFAEA